MRVTAAAGDFRARAIAGTHTVLIGLDCPEEARHGLLGFAIKRSVEGAGGEQTKWLRSLKVFKSIVPDPKEGDPRRKGKPKRFTSREHPIQSFLWGDYTAQPDTGYTFTVAAMYGRPGALEPRSTLEFSIRTEKERDKGHGIWFNRGAVASQAFTREFDNKAPSKPEDPSDRETAWLSRGLLEACLSYIDQTPAGEGLRVAAYELTYPAVLGALKAALDRGVDLRIVYDDTTAVPEGEAASAAREPGANEKAIKRAGIPAEHNGTRVLFPRTQPKIPHNKFVVRLKGGRPTSVWTGSTNFTVSGFLGQSNVGHLVDDAATAASFLSYWEVLKEDPPLEDAREAVMSLTPDPVEELPPNSIGTIFSPRPRSQLLEWYGRRIEEAKRSVMFTAAFGVTGKLVGPLAEDRDHLRFILMEKPPGANLEATLKADRDLIISFGASLGEMYIFKDGQPVARRRIAEFDLEKWFLKESHFRSTGHVFFVHTKFLLIDPLSDDPLVFTGSANFSPNSLLQNDENMLLIRGDTRVADIYLTEFDRIFRHFYFRNVANEIEAKGGDAEGAFLAETSAWTNSYFRPGSFKTKRREMFFD